MTESLEPRTPSLPSENVQRGTVFALLAVPAGIAVWLVIWGIGFVSAIVGFGVAWAASFLYLKGSGGRMGRTGAITVTVITLGTLVLAFFAGEVWDEVAYVLSQTKEYTVVELLTMPEFWDQFWGDMALNAGTVALQFGLALFFGVLGCFGTIRRTFAQARAQEAAAGSPFDPADSASEPSPFGRISPASSPSAFGPITPAAGDASEAPNVPPIPPAPPVAPETEPR